MSHFHFHSSLLSLILYFVSWVVRGAKRIFSRQDKASNTLIENYVQSAQLWMLSVQQRQEQQLDDSDPQLLLTSTSPSPQSDRTSTTTTTTTTSRTMGTPESIGMVQRRPVSVSEDSEDEETVS